MCHILYSCKPAFSSSYHETQLKVVGGGAAHQPGYLLEKIIIQRSHAIIVGYTAEEIHQNKLGVTLATIAGLGFALFVFVAALYNQNHWHLVALAH